VNFRFDESSGRVMSSSTLSKFFKLVHDTEVRRSWATASSKPAHDGWLAIRRRHVDRTYSSYSPGRKIRRFGYVDSDKTRRGETSLAVLTRILDLKTGPRRKTETR
jgi:hypothetical protein